MSKRRQSKKKDSNPTEEEKALHKDKELMQALKKRISSRDPDVIQKREKYSKRPEVKARRSELNQQRRLLQSIMTTLLESGQLYNKEGKQFKLMCNRAIIPELNVYAYLDSSHKVKFESYSEDIDLLSKPYKSPGGKNMTPEFKEALRRFAEGDPDIVSAVSTKRVFHEATTPNIDFLREIIKTELNLEFRDENSQIQESDSE